MAEDHERRIWKFSLELTGWQSLRMPKGAEVLSVRDQGGNLCLWAICDPGAETCERDFFVVGTGHAVPIDIGTFIDTVLMGQFVWHVFESK